VISRALAGAVKAVELRGEETIRGRDCYLLYISLPSTFMAVRGMRTLDEHYIWINKTDAIPVQYISNSAYRVNGETLHQYEKRSLKTYELNTDVDTSLFKLSAIPDYYTIRDHTLQKWQDPLPVGSLAPNWHLPNLNEEEVSLSDFRGNLVLLDFFYNYCTPCVLAFSGLQSLHEKYANNGVHVIGINVYSRSVIGITEHLEEHGVTYPVCYDGERIAEEYHVSHYPTIYLINKEGEIIHAKSGFGFSMMEELETIIRTELGLSK
jgi:peroxiredoxin